MYFNQIFYVIQVFLSHIFSFTHIILHLYFFLGPKPYLKASIIDTVRACLVAKVAVKCVLAGGTFPTVAIAGSVSTVHGTRLVAEESPVVNGGARWEQKKKNHIFFIYIMS